jgi:hypothetical protein
MLVSPDLNRSNRLRGDDIRCAPAALSILLANLSVGRGTKLTCLFAFPCGLKSCINT